MKHSFILILILILIFPSLPGFAEEEIPALYPICENGLWGYMNRAGETVIAPQWKTALPFSGDTAFVSLSAVSYPYSQSLSSGHYDGLIDRQGNYIIGPEPERIVQEYDTAWRIVDVEKDVEGFYDKAGGYYQPPRMDYEMVLPLGDGSGPIPVMDNDGYVGYISRKTGETVIPFQYTGELSVAAFYDGYARPRDIITELDEYGEECAWNETEYLIDSQGNDVTLPDGMVPVSYVKDGYVVYAIRLETEEAAEDSVRDPVGYDDYIPYRRGVGLARLDGTVIIEADPSIVLMSLPDENGIVCFLEDTHEAWICAGAELPLILAGHMDTEGNVIVPPTYNISDWDFITYEFVNGYAVIEDLGTDQSSEPLWFIIDTAGYEIFSRHEYAEDCNFFLDGRVQENGLIWYSLAGKGFNSPLAGQRRYGLLRIADGRAEYLTEAIYESHVCSVLPERQRENFAEGLHPVQLGGLWGYINEQAEMVIPPVWDAASSFRDGLALVEKDGKLMYIDHGGAVVWEER